VRFIEQMQATSDADSRVLPVCVQWAFRRIPYAVPFDIDGHFYEYSYVNYAWGYQFRGLIVDASGNVLTYQRPKYPTYHRELSNPYGRIGEALFTVSDDELESASRILASVSAMSMSKRENTAKDMGGYSYIAYRYDPQTGGHEKIAIANIGDWSSYNLSEGAAEIKWWLDEVESRAAEIQREGEGQQ
jgi:hypothetical protein